MRSTTPVVWLFSIPLWVTGLGLLSLGLAGDKYGWWVDRPFVTNLISGLTTAAFGLPVALLVINQLTAAQRRYAGRLEIESRYHALTAEMRQRARKAIRAASEFDRLPIEKEDAPSLYRVAALSEVEAAISDVRQLWSTVAERVIPQLRESGMNAPIGNHEQKTAESVEGFAAAGAAVVERLQTLNPQYPQQGLRAAIGDLKEATSDLYRSLGNLTGRWPSADETFSD